jgi:uncharacterized membrane protein SirB2
MDMAYAISAYLAVGVVFAEWWRGGQKLERWCFFFMVAIMFLWLPTLLMCLGIALLEEFRCRASGLDEEKVR